MNWDTPNLYTETLFKNGFYLDTKNQTVPHNTTHYSLLPSIGTGDFWVYNHNNLFSIISYDFTPYDEMYLQLKTPDSITLFFIESTSGKQLSPYQDLVSPKLCSYTNDPNNYRAIFHKNVPERAIGLEILPEYLELSPENTLESFQQLKKIVYSLNNCEDTTELTDLLQQLSLPSTENELLNLVLEIVIAALIKSKEIHKIEESQKRKIVKEDILRLELVQQYLDEHYHENIYLKDLSRIACMGTSKLKYTFKQYFNCTVTTYIQNKRIHKAEELLMTSELKVGEISTLIGYKNASRFTELFKKITGTTPYKYRKLVHSQEL